MSNFIKINKNDSVTLLNMDAVVDITLYDDNTGKYITLQEYTRLPDHRCKYGLAFSNGNGLFLHKDENPEFAKFVDQNLGISKDSNNSNISAETNKISW